MLLNNRQTYTLTYEKSDHPELESVAISYLV